MTKSNLGMKNFTWAFSFRGYSPSWCGRHNNTQKQKASQLLHFYPHTELRKKRQGRRSAYKPSKSILEYHTSSPSKLLPPKGSITSPIESPIGELMFKFMSLWKTCVTQNTEGFFRCASVEH